MSFAGQIFGKKYQKDNKMALNEHLATGPSSFARRQLESMGWKEGEGLGKHKQGRSSHISVSKRKEEEGLGHVELPKSMYEDQWWNSSVNATLAKLQKKSKKQKTTQKVITTDEELFLATGGARFGMRAQYRAEGKWARTESKVDGTMEKKAEKSMEWNGLGEAKVKLTSTMNIASSRVALQQKKIERKNIESVDEGGNHVIRLTTTPLETLMSKEIEDNRINTVSPETSSEDSSDEQASREREKRKKQKGKTEVKKAKKKSKKRKRS
jgi:Pin2-interacting protein X1